MAEFKGRPVQEAKELVRQTLIDSGNAFNYANQTDLFISRSGDECVAAHLDQWYLNYEQRRTAAMASVDQVFKHVGWRAYTFSSEAKHHLSRLLVG